MLSDIQKKVFFVVMFVVGFFDVVVFVVDGCDVVVFVVVIFVGIF